MLMDGRYVMRAGFEANTRRQSVEKRISDPVEPDALPLLFVICGGIAEHPYMRPIA
jgi:hypothetical protein